MAIVIKVQYKEPEAEHKSQVAKAVINYCMQPHKTKVEHNVYVVVGQNCTPELAFEQFTATKAAWKKTEGVFFRHYVQSFLAGDADVTPELANQIAREFADRVWKGYEVLITTHVDKAHVHSHFIVNTVHPETGKKLHEDINYLQRIRKISDEICISHGLSVLDPYKKKQKSSTMKNREYRAAYKGDSWKLRLRMAIKMAMEYSATREEFIENMKRLGYGVRWEDNRKNITYTCYNEPKWKDGHYRKCNDDKLSDDKYLKGAMAYEFELRAKIIAGRTDEPTETRTHTQERSNQDGNDLGGGVGETERDAVRDEGAVGANKARERADGQCGGELPHSDAEDGRGAEKGGSERREGTGDAHQGNSAKDGENFQRTGWETERESFRKNYQKNPHGRCPMGSEVRVGNSPNASRVGAVGLYGLASVLSGISPSNDGKTPEEIEAEENARIAEGNIGALAALSILGVEHLISRSHENEVPTNNEQTDSDEDQDYGFRMTM